MLKIAYISKPKTSKQTEREQIDRMKQMIIDQDESFDGAFTNLINSFSIRYKGMTITKEAGRFKVLRSSFATLEEAKAGIDAALENFGTGFNKTIK